jgi:predicted alpha-1,2-mannosidase
MKSYHFLILICLISIGCHETKKHDFSSYVDPFIGTDGHGHTFPGATLPFGMVQLSPDTRKDNWDGCSGYHYSDSVIWGFSHTHLSGTGVGDYGDIRFVPMTGKLSTIPATINNPGYGSRFSHQNERASPGYYQVYLDDYKINVELTATPRAGFHKYVFNGQDSSFILIDLKESITSDVILESGINFINNKEISGYRRTKGWAEDQVVYFYAIFAKPFQKHGIIIDQIRNDGANEAYGKDLKGYISYSTQPGEEVLVKVGISAVNCEGAKKNLRSEIPDWDFSQVVTNAHNTWAKELSRIEVEGGTKDQMTTFYTALYHAMIAPNLFTDIDRNYRGHDRNIHKADGFNMYTVFSLWDTYRAENPLMTIIQPRRTNDFINSFLHIYKEGGLLPVWELAGNETNCMIGYHSVPVIADAYVKGLRGFDPEIALEAMIKSARGNQYGLEAFKKYGFIPADEEGESVSKTLEYAYDDWCIAVMAKALDRPDIYKEFIQRAQYYKNLFDPETKFFRGKRDGMFTEPFDPAEVNFMLTEANTWQYTFYVPQDITGLINLMGGEEKFDEKLDEMFSSSSSLAGRQQADITGLIGQYAQGNEPSQHMAYLYNYAGKSWKAQKLVRQIMDQYYKAGPAGLCGNDDCGQMSAWYVLSALGFYSVTPGQDIYVLGSPLFAKVTLNLEDGKQFVIESQNSGPNNIYIQSTELNGKKYSRSYFRHRDIMNGGRLEYNMGPKPDTLWGSLKEDRPVSEISDFMITPVPYFIASSNTFKEDMLVSIGNIYGDCRIYYGTDSLKQKMGHTIYRKPFKIHESITLSSYAVRDPYSESKNVKVDFFKIPNDYKIKIINPYSTQYSAGGDMALVDRQRGGLNFRTGNWQGYHGVDMVVIVDLGKQTTVHKLAAGFLEDQNSWIFMPVEVTFSISEAQDNFKTIAVLKNDLPEKTYEPIKKDFTLSGLEITGRYIKIIARNIGTCPPWHKGAGEKAWIFSDEILIE